MNFKKITFLRELSMCSKEGVDSAIKMCKKLIDEEYTDDEKDTF